MPLFDVHAWLTIRADDPEQAREIATQWNGRWISGETRVSIDDGDPEELGEEAEPFDDVTTNA
jgi:hypothetical protein